MRELLRDLVISQLSNPVLAPLGDSAVFELPPGRLAFTTDSYVVRPIFFPGGDIGTLAVCGTVNDLAMAGARPLYLSLSFVIEEGFELADLRRIVGSIKEVAREAEVHIATGDLKVVERGAADKIFINTSGLGVVAEGINLSQGCAKPGDVVLINGFIGDHGMAVMSRREGISFETPIESDVAPLWPLVREILGAAREIRCLHDPTRGGLSAAMNEIALASAVGVKLYEERIPVREEVHSACEMLGLDALAAANEGKLVAVCSGSEADAILKAMRAHPHGRNAAVIGEIVAESPGTVFMSTRIGGLRAVDMPTGEELPRIC